MQLCRDQGRTHFLRSWPGEACKVEIPPGDGAILYLLARGEPREVSVVLETEPLPVQCVEPCALGSEVFRWMEAAIPPSCKVRHLTVRPASAKLARDEASGRPVVRVADGSPPEYLMPSYRDPALAFEKIRDLLPAHFSRFRHPDWREAWMIAQWIHKACTYRNTFQGTVYCPWRLEDILRAAKPEPRTDGASVITMCVHYAVAFQQCCLALGIPARALPLTAHINSDTGHFVTEIWSELLAKWVLMDSQSGICFLDETGLPLNALEVSRQSRPAEIARCGPGADQPLPGDFRWPYACSRELFRHIGVWRRADYSSSPEETPVGHGTTPYAETDILWLATEGIHPPMFPFGLKMEDYLAPPSGHKPSERCGLSEIEPGAYQSAEIR